MKNCQAILEFNLVREAPECELCVRKSNLIFFQLVFVGFLLASKQ